MKSSRQQLAPGCLHSPWVLRRALLSLGTVSREQNVGWCHSDEIQCCSPTAERVRRSRGKKKTAAVGKAGKKKPNPTAFSGSWLGLCGHPYLGEGREPCLHCCNARHEQSPGPSSVLVRHSRSPRKMVCVHFKVCELDLLPAARNASFSPIPSGFH